MLWRYSEDKNITTYRLHTVRSMTQLRKDKYERFLIASFTVENDVYVDNLMTGAETLEYLSVIKFETTDLLERGGFILRHSTTETILQNTVPEDRETLLEIDKNNVVKALVIIWNPSS